MDTAAKLLTFGASRLRAGADTHWVSLPAAEWDCLDHVIAINERQLRRVIRSSVDYYHEDRTHLGLGKDTPEERSVEPPEMGEIIEIPRVRQVLLEREIVVTPGTPKTIPGGRGPDGGRLVLTVEVDPR